MARDDFNAETKDELAKRVGVRCSNSQCRQTTSGPRDDPTKSINIGVAAHICAASDGGPRYHREMPAEHRASIDNGIWLCQNCAKMVDNDVARYSVRVLREWKEEAELAARNALEGRAAEARYLRHRGEEPDIIAEGPAEQLQRERRGEPRVPRLHFEVLLDPSHLGVIIRESPVAPKEPEDLANPNDEDPMGRILLANIGRSAAVRLRLTLPIQILSASPFPDEANAYRKDQVVQHEVLVRVLRPGAVMITVTNRLSAPIGIGFAPEAYDQREVVNENGRTKVRRKLAVQTLEAFRIRAAAKRRP
jgi:hypothetical protein